MNWTWIYIGVLYAAAIAVARRNGIDIRKRVALFFFSLVLVFFFQPLTQRTGICPWDVHAGPGRFRAKLDPWLHATGFHPGTRNCASPMAARS